MSEDHKKQLEQQLWNIANTLFSINTLPKKWKFMPTAF